jgi:hypothetical protein
MLKAPLRDLLIKNNLTPKQSLGLIISRAEADRLCLDPKREFVTSTSLNCPKIFRSVFIIVRSCQSQFSPERTPIKVELKQGDYQQTNAGGSAGAIGSGSFPTTIERWGAYHQCNSGDYHS